MSASQSSSIVQRNGLPATIEALAPLALAGYAHFTAMQVRGGRVRGLDLHLERLSVASMALFGRALADDQVRAYLRAALACAPADVSLVATVYSPAGEFTVAGADVEPEVLVRTGPPASGPRGPLALATVAHERVLPALKQVGEVAKTYFLRQSVGQGFDDAAFVDRQGRLSEGTIWNLVFWDGETVVWPEAEMLAGTTMGIVRRQLDLLGFRQRVQPVTPADLPGLAGAAVMNSWTPGVTVSRIGSVAIPETPSFLALLHRAYQMEEPVLP
ncbi:aminotransferase class IV family protein [Cupriavidus sp. D39]|uniref:aminotransferase class IV family protein n=1 Tax=Cupriavidus sp. D39 TaxID=2997877 RepID=UPI00226DECED|nr:aminotransferase class IV family protein [Cupriavidus sp. D39]MCY0856346.1 aminotransferase class IV family protein [Cupriavidus sp. D39]